jgi:putative hydrolase of the HAD superfamily
VIEALVSDFGGVLTLPLMDAFWKANEQSGIPPEALRAAMALAAEREPEPPLFRLERGQMSAGEFFSGLSERLEEVIGRAVDTRDYASRLMAAMQPNEPLLSYYRALRRERGIRLAVLTNNVREWQPYWRGAWGIDDLFELVVDSSFEGVRKPEPEIYARTLSRLDLPGEACVFVDDLEVNLPPAAALGMHTVHYRNTAQAISEIDSVIGT